MINVPDSQDYYIENPCLEKQKSWDNSWVQVSLQIKPKPLKGKGRKGYLLISTEEGGYHRLLPSWDSHIPTSGHFPWKEKEGKNFTISPHLRNDDPQGGQFKYLRDGHLCQTSNQTLYSLPFLFPSRSLINSGELGSKVFPEQQWRGEGGWTTKRIHTSNLHTFPHSYI